MAGDEKIMWHRDSLFIPGEIMSTHLILLSMRQARANFKGGGSQYRASLHPALYPPLGLRTLLQGPTVPKLCQGI